MAEDAPKAEDVPKVEDEPKADDSPKEEPAEAEKPLFQMSVAEKRMEQKIVKTISRMPDNIKSRFQSLSVFSDERSKINDLFE